MNGLATQSPRGAEEGWGEGMAIRILLWNAFGAPAPEAIVILEHLLKIFSTDRLFIFAEGFIKESLWKGILFWVEALAKIEFPSLILSGG